jgi:hypothetical protein
MTNKMIEPSCCFQITWCYPIEVGRIGACHLHTDPGLPTSFRELIHCQLPDNLYYLIQVSILTKKK